MAKKAKKTRKQLEAERKARYRLEANQAFRDRRRQLNGQEKKAAIRAKYGASGRPALVVVKALDGEVVKVVDQSRFKPRV